MKKYLLLALLPLLYACSDSPTHRRGINYDEVFSKDTQGLDILTGQFSHNIDRIWGVNELLVAFYKSSDPFMAEHWFSLGFVDYLFKLFVGIVLFVPAYGVVLSMILRKLQSLASSRQFA